MSGFKALRERIPDRAVDPILFIAFFLGGLAVRLPCFMLVPPFTDELYEVLRGLKISRGEIFPLTNVATYHGAMPNYLTAGFFHLVGPSVQNARLLVTLLGALTVSLTYLLGRETESRRTGVVAALLMLTSTAATLHCHVAWGSCMSPAFVTAALLAFTVAMNRGSGRWLVVSGFLYGLSLQTHALIVAAAPGLVVYFAYAGLFPARAGSPRSLVSWMKSPWPYLAVAAAIVGYGNMVAQNLLEPGSSWALAQHRRYALVLHPTLATYLDNLQGLGWLLLQMVSSDFTHKYARGSFGLMPPSLLFLGCFIVGIAWAVRRGKLLPVLVVASSSIVLPYVNKKYSMLFGGRYTSFLLPFLYLLCAAPLAEALRKGAGRIGWKDLYPWLVAVLLVASPLYSMARYYEDAGRTGHTNAQVLAVYRIAKAAYRSESMDLIVLDSEMKAPVGVGAKFGGSMAAMLTVEGIPAKDLVVSVDSIREELATRPSGRLEAVLLADKYAELKSAIHIERVEAEQDSEKAGHEKYGVYILDSNEPPAR